MFKKPNDRCGIHCSRTARTRGRLLAGAITVALVASYTGGYAADTPAITEQLKQLTEGWSIAQEAFGDLNADGTSDAAVILVKRQREATGRESSNEAGKIEAATLEVFFADQDGKLRLQLQAPKAVCADCGGALNAAQELAVSLAIEKGVLQLEYHAGSREESGVLTKWRFQSGDFFLIGVDSGVADTRADEKGAIWSIDRDANISTLRMKESVNRVESVTADGGVKMTRKTTTCRVPASYKDVKLGDYSVEEFTPPSCTSISL